MKAWMAVYAIALFLAAWSFFAQVNDASAAVATAGTVSTMGDDSSSFSLSHTVPSGSDRLLVVTIGCGDGAKFAASATWNGTDMGSTFFDETAGSNKTRNLGFRLVAPAETTANVVVTMDGRDKSAIVECETWLLSQFPDSTD